MAGYVPWHQKKRLRLLVAEYDFIALLKSSDNDRVIAAGAERVRQAKLAELRSRRAELPPCEKNDRAIAELNQKILHWTSLEAAQIFDRYRS